MNFSEIPTARVHSQQSLGAVDGPGIRYVIFLQGCPDHCPYCHNPDTRPLNGGDSYSVSALADRVERYKPYFGKQGGVTVSGGEPLLQSVFLAEFFKECHRRGISTCLDTAGLPPDAQVRAVLTHTDTVLCDIKDSTDEGCRSRFGTDLSVTRAFLAACDDAGCDIWARHVVVPGMTDQDEHIRRIAALARTVKNLKKIELLPFRKLCSEKYTALGLPFPLADTPECDAAQLTALNALLTENA